MKPLCLRSLIQSMICRVAMIMVLAFGSLPISAQSFSTTSLESASNPEDVIAADLNHDLLPDLIVLHRRTALISTFINLGGGAFSVPYTIGTEPDPISIDAVDVDGDGNLDLVVGLATRSAFAVYVGNGNGTFLPPRDYGVQGWPVSLSLVGSRGFPGEFLRTEVLSTSIDRISIAESRGDTTFVEPQLVYQADGRDHLTHGLFRDFNNDGLTDILFAQCCGDDTVPRSKIFLMSRGPDSLFEFGAPVQVGEINQARSLIAGDIRQDGNIGFMATFGGCSAIGCQGVMLFEGLGNGTFNQIRLDVPASRFDVPHSPQLIDFNGDGLNDIVVAVHDRAPADGSAAHDSVLVWTANKDGSYQPYKEVSLITNGLDVPTAATNLSTVDFNSDGKLDLVVASPRGSSITLLTNKSAQQTAFCAPRTDGPSVVSCAPVNDAVIDSTDLIVNCSASSTMPITGCNAYIDGILMHRTGGATFEQKLLIPPGKHVAVIRAWDSTGKYFQTARHLTLRNRYLAICRPGSLETVNFCVPSHDGTISSPVRVLATGSSESIVTATNIYVDGTLTLQGGMFIDTRLQLNNGSHRIVVKSWNRNGTSFSATRNILVDSQGCALGAFLSVHVCSPEGGTTVYSPVHLEAIANSDRPITGWRVYLNSVSIYASIGEQLNTDLALPKGDVTLLIKAWDSQGRIVGSVIRNFSVQ